MAFVPIRRTTMFANYDQSLPFVLYWVRIRQGLSQTDVARRAHVHRLWISNVETGDKCPAINGLEKLAGALGVKVSRIGQGIPVGSAVEYVDLSTLTMSLNSRRVVDL